MRPTHACRFPALFAIFIALLFATASPAASQPLFGFNEDWQTHSVASSDPFRPTAQRLQLNWSLIESVRGTYQWSSFDAQYKAIVNRGAAPIAMVFAPPCWAAVKASCPATRVYPIAERSYPDWGRFIRAVVARYPRLAGLEVWNEPNYAAYHYPSPSVSSYVNILKHAYAASRAVRPDLPVLGGSLAPLTSRSRARRGGGFPRAEPGKRYPYALFLDRMYRMGAARYMDGLAFHPYPNFARYLKRGRLRRGVRRGFARGIGRDIKKQLGTVRRIQRRHGALAPIWATETGVCTTGPRERKARPREQAVALRQIYLTLERLRARAILIHRLLDVRVPGTSPNNIENGCGMTDIRGRRKPAWHTLRRLRASRFKAGRN